MKDSEDTDEKDKEDMFERGNQGIRKVWSSCGRDLKWKKWE